MAAPSYADLKKKVKDLQTAEGVLKSEIERLAAEPGTEGSPEAATAIESKGKAEAETAELQKQIEALTAQIATLTEGEPDKVILTRPYAFFDDSGVFQSFDAGEVTNPDHIATLRERGVI